MATKTKSEEQSVVLTTPPQRADRSKRDELQKSTLDDGKEVYRFKDVLDFAYKRGFVGFKSGDVEVTTIVGVDGSPITMAIAEVYALFRDENGQESLHFGAGDASIENTDAPIAVHLVRVAETRAKARALAHALNLDTNLDVEFGSGARPATATRSTKKSSSSSSTRRSAPAVDLSQLPPKNDPENDGWCCEVCGKPIKSTQKYRAEDLVARSYAATGKVLCYEHRMKSAN